MEHQGYRVPRLEEQSVVLSYCWSSKAVAPSTGRDVPKAHTRT